MQGIISKLNFGHPLLKKARQTHLQEYFGKFE